MSQHGVEISIRRKFLIKTTKSSHVGRCVIYGRCVPFCSHLNFFALASSPPFQFCSLPPPMVDRPPIFRHSHDPTFEATKIVRDVQDRLSRFCWRDCAFEQQPFGCSANPQHPERTHTSRCLRKFFSPYSGGRLSLGSIVLPLSFGLSDEGRVGGSAGGAASRPVRPVRRRLGYSLRRAQSQPQENPHRALRSISTALASSITRCL